MIWGYAIAMMLVAIIVILLPLWFRPGQQVTLDSNTANVALLKQQLQELEADFANGNMPEEQYDRARIDLEAAVAVDLDDESGVSMQSVSLKTRRLLSLILMVVVPLSSVAIYREITTFQDVPPTPDITVQHAMEEVAGEKLPPIDQMVEKLAARLRDNPEDAQGWKMLGKTYVILERTADAVGAYEHAYNLLGDSDPEFMIDFAEALAISNNSLMAGRPVDLVVRALEIQPGMPKGLWFAGFASYQAGDYTSAVKHWTQVLQNPQIDAETQQMLRAYIADSRSKLGLDPVMEEQIADSRSRLGVAPQRAEQVVKAPGASKPQSATSSASIQVQVALDPSMKDKASQNEIVFVFAKAAAGMPAPLAVKKLTVADLPTTVMLDDSMAMMPGHNLSSKDLVIVGARVSRNGTPMSQPGDLQGLSGSLNPGETNQVSISINQLVQ
jgi:cytochrome c-type biogenesis protein CcmH